LGDNYLTAAIVFVSVPAMPDSSALRAAELASGATLRIQINDIRSDKCSIHVSLVRVGVESISGRSFMRPRQSSTMSSSNLSFFMPEPTLGAHTTRVKKVTSTGQSTRLYWHASRCNGYSRGRGPRTAHGAKQEPH